MQWQHTHLAVKVLLKKGDLLEYETRRHFGQTNEKLGEGSRTFRILSVELLVCNLPTSTVPSATLPSLMRVGSPEYILSQLGVVEIFGENVDQVCHRLGQMLRVLQVLHDCHLCAY